jgi:hypothetical protein
VVSKGSGIKKNTDKMPVRYIPNALVLFNPFIDNGPGGYGYDRIGDACKSFSALHNIKNGTPPTILFLGKRSGSFCKSKFCIFRTKFWFFFTEEMII